MSPKLIITTVSRFFSDKAGAAPQSNISEGLPNRPSLLHRLHIRSSSSRRLSPAGTESRPVSSSSKPSRSLDRSTEESFNDAPVIVQQAIMPHSLEVKTPPSPNAKRQRSADGRDNYLTPSPARDARSASETQSPTPSVKIPAFLNKSRSGKLSFSLKVPRSEQNVVKAYNPVAFS